ncbi:MAG: GNAT family N-acetyltransferase [Anaerolineales bacterium]|nr:GNAT family N-acetyltransferase [Anaerolineales bacterium]
MKIELLADHPEAIPVIARWHWAEWGHYNPEGSFGLVLEKLSQRVHRERIPFAYLALQKEIPMGTASLVELDMDTRKDLSPWLAGVYVDPAFRNRGVGSALVQKVCEKAEQLRFDELFLYTNTAYDLYKKLGWFAIEQEQYRGRLVSIMKYTF